MKKQLLSTSALVAAGLIAAAGSTGTAQAQQVVQAPAASPIQISVGGYMRQFVGYSDNGNMDNARTTATAKASKFHQHSDTEIYFQGKTTLANGISVAVRVELEGNTSNDMIDETFAAVEGAFGRLELGSTDGSFAKTFISAPGTGILSNITPFGQYGQNGARAAGLIGVQSGTAFAVNFGDDDSEKISYYTPRFEGFQLGLSYVPRSMQDTHGGAGVAMDGQPATPAYVKGMIAGLNFTRDFGAVNVAAGAGYYRWSKPDATTAAQAAQFATMADPKAYGYGAQIGYAGWRVGVGYVRHKDMDLTLTQAAAGAAAGGGGAAAGVVSDGSVFEAGLTYTFGPAVVGINWTTSTSVDTTSLGLGSGSYDAIQVSGRYTVGPGVDVTAGVYQYKVKGEQTANNAAGSDSDNNRSTGVIAGLGLTF